MKYFIGHLLSKEVENYYKKITLDLSNKFGIKNLSEYIPPHFTFKPPFEFNNEELLKEEIRGVIKDLETFNIKIYDFGNFYFESRTIYLKPKNNEDIQNKLKDIILKTNNIGDKNIKARDPFELHISIARYLDHDKFEEIWSYLKLIEKPNIDREFNNLTLFVKENDNWIVRETCRFY